jgi:dienelactone hydrolase
MSALTWVMLIVICGFTWGGFVALLAYGARHSTDALPDDD